MTHSGCVLTSSGGIGAPLHVLSACIRTACVGRPGPFRVFSHLRHFARRFWNQICQQSSSQYRHPFILTAQSSVLPFRGVYSQRQWRKLFPSTEICLSVCSQVIYLREFSTFRVEFFPLVQFKLATVVYRSLNGTAPSYLAADLRRLADVPSRRRLRSSLTHQLDVRQSQCATVGNRSFSIAGARLWNSLPKDLVACASLPRFRRELKTFLFRQSYHSILI